MSHDEFVASLGYLNDALYVVVQPGQGRLYVGTYGADSVATLVWNEAQRYGPFILDQFREWFHGSKAAYFSVSPTLFVTEE